MQIKSVFALTLSVAISTAALGQAAVPHVMPPLDRPWVPADYTMAVDMIAKKETPLPFYLTGGGPLLKHYLASENLNALSNPARSASERLLALNTVSKATGQLYNLYLDAIRNGKVAHLELGHVYAMLLQLIALQALAVDQFVNDGDASSQNQQATIAQMGERYAGLFGGVADSCTDKKVFGMADCTNILNMAGWAYPKVDHYINADNRTHLRQKFQILRDQDNVPSDQRNIDKLLAVMSK